MVIRTSLNSFLEWFQILGFWGEKQLRQTSLEKPIVLNGILMSTDHKYRKMNTDFSFLEWSDFPPRPQRWEGTEGAKDTKRTRGRWQQKWETERSRKQQDKRVGTHLTENTRVQKQKWDQLCRLEGDRAYQSLLTKPGGPQQASSFPGVRAPGSLSSGDPALWLQETLPRGTRGQKNSSLLAFSKKTWSVKNAYVVKLLQW